MINLDCLSTVFLRYDWNTRWGTSIKWTAWWALGLSQYESIITVKIVTNSPVPRMPPCLQYVLSIPHSQTPTNVLPVTMGLISFSRTLHESNPIIMLFGGEGTVRAMPVAKPQGRFPLRFTRVAACITNPCVLTGTATYLHIPLCCTWVSGLGAVTDETMADDHAQVVLRMVWSVLVNTWVDKSYSKYMFGFPRGVQLCGRAPAAPTLVTGRALTLAFPREIEWYFVLFISRVPL